MKNETSKKDKGQVNCKHGLTIGFCAYCNPNPKQEPETEPETTETETTETPKMSKEIWKLLNEPSTKTTEPEPVTIQAYKIILESIKRNRKRVDKVVRGTLVEQETKETYLETKPAWEPLEFTNDVMIKVLSNKVNPWCLETPENLVRYIRGSIRNKLINIKQEMVEQPLSFWESPETLETPDISNEVSTFKKDLFEMVLNATRKNGKPLLNDKEKNLFIQYYGQGKTYSEIATETQGNVDSIRVELSRINRKMGQLPLKDYFNATFCSPSGVYFPHVSTDVSDVRTCNIAPLKRYRITKDIKDLEMFRQESLDHLKYQKKHGCGTLTTVNPKDYVKPEPWKPFGILDSKTIWDNWKTTPVYNKWFSTGRNGGFTMHTVSTLWVEKRNRKPLGFKREKTVERVVYRGKSFDRNRNPINGKPYTKKDRIKHLATLALNRGNIPYYRTLQGYLASMI